VAVEAGGAAHGDEHQDEECGPRSLHWQPPVGWQSAVLIVPEQRPSALGSAPHILSQANVGSPAHGRGSPSPWVVRQRRCCSSWRGTLSSGSPLHEFLSMNVMLLFSTSVQEQFRLQSPGTPHPIVAIIPAMRRFIACPTAPAHPPDGEQNASHWDVSAA